MEHGTWVCENCEASNAPRRKRCSDCGTLHLPRPREEQERAAS